MEEDLNSQVHRIILPVDNSQCLSSATLVLTPVPNGLMSGVHSRNYGDREEGQTQAQQHGISLNKADLPTATAECSPG